MPSYNRMFDLSIADIALIEEALRARGRELSRMRLALEMDNPVHVEKIGVIVEDQRASRCWAGCIVRKSFSVHVNRSMSVGEIHS
ncbi:hypothetical protein [Yoonia sp.]|uniref:hypothetical protein n=1 Tax=Yoonia sp. TaxID=2212373 RepID=UPI00391DDE50